MIKHIKGLANFNFTSDVAGFVPKGKFILNILLVDPRFLHACGDTLEKLNTRFKDKLHGYHMEYNYDGLEYDFE